MNKYHPPQNSNPHPKYSINFYHQYDYLPNMPVCKKRGPYHTHFIAVNTEAMRYHSPAPPVQGGRGGIGFKFSPARKAAPPHSNTVVSLGFSTEKGGWPLALHPIE